MVDGQESSSGTEKDSDITWCSVKAIVNFVLDTSLITQEEELSQRREYLNWEILNIINEKLVLRNKYKKPIYTN